MNTPSVESDEDEYKITLIIENSTKEYVLGKAVLSFNSLRQVRNVIEKIEITLNKEIKF